MPVRNIVISQKIDPQKAERAKELRRSMTEAEKLLWQRLRANRLDGWHFRRQQVIAGFIVDFYCHASGLVVEVDGEVHLGQVEQDNDREQALQELGLRILRFTNQEVRQNLPAVLQKIRGCCSEETSPPAPPRSGEGCL